MVVFGAFFLLSLVLSPIMDSFENVDNEIEMETLKEGIAEVEVQAYKKRQKLI